MANRTWNQLKAAAKTAAGTAWVVSEDDPRYLTFTDAGTTRTVQAYHEGGKTVVAGATVTIREAAVRIAAELESVDRFGGLGSFDRLRKLGEPMGKPGRRFEGKAVSLRLPDEMVSALDARAGELGISRAEVARRLLGAALYGERESGLLGG